MAQIAAWLKNSGGEVSGSDEGVYPPMSDFLRSRGIEIRSPYRAENVPSVDTAVIGNALSRNNPEVEAVLEKRIPFVSLPELIHSQILQSKLPIVVAGTHGKTTTSAILAHILLQAGFSPGYMIGGLPMGWSSGFEAGSGRWFVIEGDEYDSAFFDKRPKFLHYQPQVVVLNNVEFDHADIYSSLEEIYTQFARLVQLIPRNGCLLVNADEPGLEGFPERAPCPAITFGTNAEADVRGEITEITSEGMEIRLGFASGRELVCTAPLWGDHQLSNLLSAAAAAEFTGVPPEKIAAAIATFPGIRRRMELKYSDGHRWIYDDFAHHPTAIKAVLTSLKKRHPEIQIVAVLEPRSNTMVRNFFQDEIVEALQPADRVIIGSIHRRDGIPPDERLNVDRVIERLRLGGKEAFYEEDIDEIVALLQKKTPRDAVIVMLSNGAFSGLMGKLLASRSSLLEVNKSR